MIDNAGSDGGGDDDVDLDDGMMVVVVMVAVTTMMVPAAVGSVPFCRVGFEPDVATEGRQAELSHTSCPAMGGAGSQLCGQIFFLLLFQSDGCGHGAGPLREQTSFFFSLSPKTPASMAPSKTALGYSL